MELSRYLDVLGPERKRFLDSAQDATFIPATVLGDSAWRKASVCFNWSLMNEAKALLCPVLGLDPDSELELQLTVSRADDYFRPHVDNGQAVTAHRRTSFVYYLGERDTFVGGTLNFPELGLRVEPIDDSLVSFDSGELHEITPVLPTRAWPYAARFTVNGWAR